MTIEESNMRGPTTHARTDGNAAAGPLGEIFCLEPTAATGTCRHCGGTSAIGAAHAYLSEMGLVLRCSDCEEVILRVVAAPAGTVLDASGLASIQFSASKARPGNRSDCEPRT